MKFFIANDKGEKMTVHHTVYVFDDECWKCKQKIKLAFIETEPYVIREIGDEGLELIKDKPYANIKKVYSKTLEREVWGNICPKCDAYQGNWYLFSKFAEADYCGEAKKVDVMESNPEET